MRQPVFPGRLAPAGIGTSRAANECGHTLVNGPTPFLVIALSAHIGLRNSSVKRPFSGQSAGASGTTAT